MSTDLLGQCVTEAELDDPATWMNKAGKLPRTCFDGFPERSQEVLAQALGHEPSQEEWNSFSMAWCRVSMTCGLEAPEPPEPTEIAVTPLPGGAVLLIGAIAAIGALKRRMRK